MKRGGEEPGTEDRGRRAVTEDDADADTTGQLRAMRSVWLSMRDEDPPDGGLVDLLSAARAKAETLRVRPTLRQRVAAWIRRPPALAFATVVVLVGGAVLVMGRSSGHRNSDLAAGSSGAFADRPPPAEAADHVRAPTVVAPTAPMRIATSPTVAGGVERDAATEKTATGEELAGVRAGLLDEDATTRDAGKQLEQLYAQCSSAAKRGDCAAVRTMIGKIAKTDRGYRARIAKDTAVARCLVRAVDAADALAE